MWKKILTFVLAAGAALAVTAGEGIDLKIGDFKPGGENDMPKG